MQHIPTLLAQHLKAPAKRSQHLNATYPKIVGRNMVHAVGHLVATYCDMLDVENLTSAHARAQHCVDGPGQTTTTSCNIHICRMKNLTILKFESSTPNMSQQGGQTYTTSVAPENVAMCWLDMLLSFGRGFKLHRSCKQTREQYIIRHFSLFTHFTCAESNTNSRRLK